MKKAGSIISIIAGVFGVIAAIIQLSIGGIGEIVEVEGAGDRTARDAFYSGVFWMVGRSVRG